MGVGAWAAVWACRVAARMWPRSLRRLESQSLRALGFFRPFQPAPGSVQCRVRGIEVMSRFRRQIHVSFLLLLQAVVVGASDLSRFDGQQGRAHA